MATAPAGAVRGRVELIVNSHSAGAIYWDDIYRYRANGGELIVDGTIYGNYIAANAITGGLIASSGIITQIAQIGDGLTTDAKIANLAVDTLNVAGNAISTVSSATTAGSISLPRGRLSFRRLWSIRAGRIPCPFTATQVSFRIRRAAVRSRYTSRRRAA
ncbi:hypothetical protein [Defluviimonas sp. SAOS-178_SWC]|uniref:hypothetical protein n=1 Tax=Defluviimonas sp. SAOS-178_SWC TaxID=3121287 RepID=UPI00322209AD